MNSAKTVTATFTAAPRAKVGETGYTTLQLAYNNTATTNGSVIRLLAGAFGNTLTAGTGKTVTLEGGYNAAYSGVSTRTTIQGPVRIGAGTVRMKGVNVK
jgi:hypothetical protein